MAITLKNKDQDRIINLIPTNLYKTALVIIDKAEEINHNQLHQLFPAANFSFLSMRAEKQDKGTGQNYTLHGSDLRFGFLKNDRLKALLRTNYDILIDLSNHKKLHYFSSRALANLKTGCFDKPNNHIYDLLVNKYDTNKEIVEAITKQIDKLTLNKIK